MGGAEVVPIWVIAHRGFSSEYPENTLLAFREAERIGADMVECDVHLTRDGELAVIHDSTLDRTTNGTGPVASRSMDELRRFDAGRGERIPTLAELLGTVSVPVVVEIKTADAVPALIALYHREPGLVERLFPISFGHRAIRAITEAVPKAFAGVLYAGSPVEPSHLAQAAGAQLLSPYIETISAHEVEDAHRHGLRISPWTVDRETELEYCEQIGTDGVASNRPDLALSRVRRG